MKAKAAEWKPTKAQLASIIRKMELTKTSIEEVLETIGPLEDLDLLQRLHLTQSEYIHLVQSLNWIIEEQKSRY